MPTTTDPIAPPAAPAVPAQVTLNVPAVNSIHVHNRHGSVFAVVSVGPDLSVSYARLGDNAIYHLPLARFVDRLRPITGAEQERLAQVLPAFVNSRTPVTIVGLNNPPAAQAPQAPQAQAVPVPPSAPVGVPGDSSVEVASPRRRRNETAEVGVLVSPSERDTFERLVLYPATESTIAAGLRAIENRDQMDALFGVSQIQPLTGRCCLNFYGPPGTGKTQTAKAIARRLGKNLYQVDYAACISKYVGDTAKHIQAAFAKATELNAILFFDEADALLSKRLEIGQDCATSINQNRNTLMQELDRFNGVVIFTTNIFSNYDEALLRRIAKHVEFALPNKDMRASIFDKHLPVRERIRDIDWSLIAECSEGFGGGDILNVCLNAIEAACADADPANWWLTQDILLCKIGEIREAKVKHAESLRKKNRQKAASPRPPESVVVKDVTL